MSQHDLATLVKNITAKLASGEREAAGLLLDVAPQHPLFAILRGLHASLCGQYQTALDYYQQAANVGIRLPDLPYHQAQALLNLRRYDEALATLGDDESTQALLIKEELFAQQKRYDAAATVAKRLIASGHRTPHIVANYLASAAKACDWSADISAFTDAELSPAILVFYTDDAAQMNRVARARAATFPRMSQRPVRAPRAGRRLKIGYLSDDFRHHATAHLMVELFGLHDRTCFESYAFSYGINDGSAVRARITKTVDHFIDLAGKQPLDVHNALHDAELDILVDLKGHAHNNLLPWLATRPAPLMLHYLGFPGPTAAPYIDFNIADDIVVPKGREFGDALLRLPGCCYQLNDRHRKAAAPQTRAAYGLPDDAIVLGSFNQTSKIRHDWFMFMLDVLRDFPRTVLWQYCDVPEAEARLRAIMQQQGIAPERMVITGPMPVEQHLARMAVADVMPDTIPCGGHTTTSEALWMGLPVVTLAGDSWASRVSASLLHYSGFDELVTTSFADYQKLLRELLATPDRLYDLRQRITAARNTCALFDSPRWVKTWEATITTAYDKVTSA